MSSISQPTKSFSAAHLFELSLRVDVHVADLTMESLVLESCRHLRRRGQLGLHPRPREGLDGSVAAPCLQHCLVLSAWVDIEWRQQSVKNTARRSLNDSLASPTVSHRYCGPAAGRPSWRPPCRGSSREDVWLSLPLFLPPEPHPPLRLFVYRSPGSEGQATGRGRRVLSRFQRGRCPTVPPPRLGWGLMVLRKPRKVRLQHFSTSTRFLNSCRWQWEAPTSWHARRQR